MNENHAYAAAVARGIINEYGIKRPAEIDLEAIAAMRNVFVREAELKGSSARLLRGKGGGVIRVDNTIQHYGQRRFCIAHEIGHLYLHEKVDQWAICTSRDMLPGYRRRPEEPEANSFAAELLMPEGMFRERCMPGDLRLTMLEDLASEFRTTISATTFRYTELGIDVCAVVRSEDGCIKWSKSTADFRFRLPEWGSRLDGRTCASEFFDNPVVPKTEEDVPACAWLHDDRIEQNWTIREIMIPMPNYNSALSVLWIVPDSDLDVLEIDDLDPMGR